MSYSTPPSSRHNRDSNRGRDRDTHRSQSRHAPAASSSFHHHHEQPAELPTYEPPSAPLNAAGKRALAALLQSHSLSVLKTHLQHAGEKLTDSAGEVNERATDARVRYEKRVKRRRERRQQHDEEGEGSDGDGDGDEGGEELGRLEEQVRSVSGGLEGRMRGVVDSEVRFRGLVDGIGELEREEEEGGGGGGGRTTRRMRREEGGEDEDEDDELGIPPTQELTEKIARCQTDWESLSLTERYSKNNAYIGFYRIVHDSKHPGDEVPPLPHSSTWFAHLENTSSPLNAASQAPARPGKRTRDPSPAESDDIAVERERVSLKCPLTLLMFRDPVTSTKCPHSFEREAIESMLAHSQTDKPVPGSGRGRRNRVRYIKCPVCSLELTADDLRSDPALQRKVRRAEAMTQRREEEEELSDGEEDGQRKRRITLASTVGSDSEDGQETETEHEAVRIKQEKAGSVFDC